MISNTEQDQSRIVKNKKNGNATIPEIKELIILEIINSKLLPVVPRFKR